MEDQVGALVGGKAAGKTDGQHVGVEHDPGGDGLHRVVAAFHPTLAGAFERIEDQFALEVQPDIPQFVVRDCIHL